MKLNIQRFADGGDIIIPVHLDSTNAKKEFDSFNSYIYNEMSSFNEDFIKMADYGMQDVENISGDMADNMRDASNNAEELKKEFDEVKSTITKSNSGLENVVTKVGKWGLAVFGIRTAYNLIRQSVSQLAQENEILAGKLEIIKGSLANAISPIAEGLVNIVYKLLAYLNVITKSFFGLDLFAKSSKSAKKTYGTAQKIRKTIAGFDEMNVLNDNVSGGGGGGGGTLEPNIPEPDTSKFQKWVDKYKTMWNDLLAIDRNEAVKLFLQSDKQWGLYKLGIFDMAQGMARTFQGAFDTIGGLWDIIIGWATDDDERLQKGLEKVKKGVTEIVLGLLQIVVGKLEYYVGQIWGVIYGLYAKFKEKFVDPVVKNIRFIKDNFESFKADPFKFFINGLISLINKAIGKINDKLKISISDTMANMLSALGVKNIKKGSIQIFKIPTIPQLAQGGIVNLPSKGVPIGGALAGERGAEGVIPLTDSQQMALLGEAIGRYITINANITNTMNGRVISRELQKIQNESSFAGNR